ncbi:hypothetical protein [Agrobacterium rosae]|uniref:Glycosyltransferase family 1 protein n=2 Tax=Agrobacterium rosae TaxID=1972867 RepID=A0A1R3U7Y5_9HYPH|nr:hypothetical protein [Agrobacterium rosae]KAA3507659.1 hypothetical protein DXM21_24360 [Agrobacterium rosae]KAA3512539.1 hypothetical protein DXM25_24550 [Agrobacterium rosae]MQB51242.1 hypothetical protein [Agrobacterium rosae]SCX34055.1 hypothetical protein DSM25559_4357 [Agrobacterium rosae]
MTQTEPMRSYFANLLPQPRLRAGGNNAPRKEIKRVILFGRHPNPTADYYFSARLSSAYGSDFHLADIRNVDFKKIDPDGAFVIVCRYASSRVLDWISEHQEKLAGVGLFLDDNIPAIITGEDASIAYRLFLFYRALLPLRRLNRHLDTVWVSTPKLAACLADVEAVILPPSPPENLWRTTRSSDAGQDILIAYHATSVHYSEHLFLRPVIADVLARRPQAKFEVFAGKMAARIWEGMERTVVRTPTSWSEYVEETIERRIDIMLVPLTPSLVNDCRAPTKRIDVARTGAAGVFSACEAYGFPDGGDEILLPNDPKAWVEAIISLLDRPDLRTETAMATRNLVEAMVPTSLWKT